MERSTSGAAFRFVAALLLGGTLSCDGERARDQSDHSSPAAVAPATGHLVRALTTPLARGIGLPGKVSWDVESGVRGDGSFARFAVATAQLQEGAFIQVGIVDLDGA